MGLSMLDSMMGGGSKEWALRGVCRREELDGVRSVDRRREKG